MTLVIFSGGWCMKWQGTMGYMDGIDFMGLGRIGNLFHEHNTVMAITNFSFSVFSKRTDYLLLHLFHHYVCTWCLFAILARTFFFISIYVFVWFGQACLRGALSAFGRLGSIA
jgi:hypothetical protein